MTVGPSELPGMEKAKVMAPTEAVGCAKSA
jgi:hypothetical protein